MDQEILQKIRETTERYFRTSTDPDQMQISEWTTKRLLNLHPLALNVWIENGEPLSWTVSIPTSRESAERFLRGEINECELTDEAVPHDRYEALYLCVAYTVPECRCKGYATDLYQEAIRNIPLEDDALIYAWIWNEDGNRLVNRLEKATGKSIRTRK